MDETIKVLHLGCKLYEDASFLGTLSELMGADPRIEFNLNARKRLDATWPHDGEGKQRLMAQLNGLLLGKAISNTLAVTDFHQVFDFNIPSVNGGDKIKFEAFGLISDECYGDPRIVRPAMRALQRPYDVLGLCETCAENQLGLTHRDIARLTPHYDASGDITPKELIDFARK